MSVFILSLKSVLAKRLSSLLSVLLFGFGVGIIVVILLTSSFLRQEINKNASNIDLVVGAKGSPLQIILASIFHIDFPTGNISLADANNLSQNRFIESAIPMSLGDSYRGYRIVGTTEKYLELYGGQLGSGEPFDSDMTVVVGSSVADALSLSVGDEVQSAHGLSDGGGDHDEHPYRISGILEPSGTVLDKLILTSIQSVWDVHGYEEEHEHDDEEHLHETILLEKLGVEVTREQLQEEFITTMLVKYRSPMGAVQLPRIVNNTSNLQAASPPYETARLFNLIGVGVEVVNILGLVVIVLSAASVFIALINSLKERRYELAIMRAMGASRAKIFILILSEGFLLTVFGCLFGFGLAHLGFGGLGMAMDEINTSFSFFVGEEYYVLAGSLIVGIFASLVPALLAYRADISETLAKG